MSLNRTTTWMAALAGVCLLALPASGQGLQDMQVFAPAEISSYGGGVRAKEGLYFTFDYLHWSFSAPDGEPIGDPSAGRPKFYGPEEGDSVIQTNSLDTSIFSEQWETGQRFEIGDRWDHHGWMFGTTRFDTNNSEIVANGVSMNWDDPVMGTLNRRRLQGYYLIANATPPAEPDWPSDVPVEDRIWVGPIDPEDSGDTVEVRPIYNIFGYISGYVTIVIPAISSTQPAVLRELPVVFDDFKVKNSTDTWGTELMYTYRTHPQKHGGFFEFYAGARYLEYNDLFSVDARNRLAVDADTAVAPEERIPYYTPGASLADSWWATSADNHIVGPQLGLRWFITSERWTFDTSGRFVAGFNSQNISQQGTLASDAYPGSKYTSDIEYEPADFQGRPLFMAKSSFTHQEHETEWSPIVELRLNLQYQLTRAIAVRGGWSGMWIDGIARGSSLNVYRLPDMGIDLTDNRQDVFMHGFNLGVLWNY